MRIRRNGSVVASSSIFAAGEDEFNFDEEESNMGDVSEMSFDDTPDGSDDDELEETLDGISEDIEDLQDDVDEIQEDDVSIELDNNISGHYIAECDSCKGIFISAVTESDQAISSIKGICPLCSKESEQYLKWVIKPVK